MSGFSRREVLLEGLLVLVVSDNPCHAFVNHGTADGCCVRPEAAPELFSRAGTVNLYQSGNEKIEPRSGKPELDRALAQSLSRLSRTWDVLPGFGYYREPKNNNARATERTMLERSDGTVLFGLGLLDELLKLPQHPDASIVAVCAHEFAHIVQYKSGLIAKLAPSLDQPFRAEQHADYLAGFYAGLRRLEHKDYPAVAFAMTQRRFGGATRGSHGTVEERGEAVQEGFKAAFDRRVSAHDGIVEGFNFAMSRK
jgi:hypothetical protein